MKHENLTNPQKSILYTEQYFKGTAVNNLCGTILIHEKIDFEKLVEAIHIFLRDNDSLRIHLTLNENQEFVQFVSDEYNFDASIVSLKNEKELAELENKLVDIPFSLVDSQLSQLQLFVFPDQTGGLIVKAHHLVCDACTASLIASKIITIYSALLKGEESPLEPASYLAYVQSEKEYLSSPKFEKDKAYWEGVFDKSYDIGSIPSTRETSIASCKASRKSFVLSKNKVEQINTFCSENKISVFNFFMALYAIYIEKLTNLEEFVIGTPILNRSTFVEKNTPGMFISTMPFKFSINPTSTFVDFAKSIAFDSLSMFRHQKYPYPNVLEYIRSKNPSQPNLYDILISYQNTKTNRNDTDIAYEVRWTFNHNVADSMQIHLFDMNDEDVLNIAYDYRVDKYSEEDICAIHDRICFMIEQLLENTKLSISDMSVVTPEEKNKLLNEFNDTYLDYNPQKTLIDYFEEQVKRTPNNVAMVFQNEELTYLQLNERVNSLANFLRNNHVTNNCIIGVMLNRSFEMMVSILAVLKAGGAYIPIDPEYPEERISFMLSQSKSKILISQKHLKDKIKKMNFEGQVIFSDFSENDIYSLDNKNLDKISKPEDLSYIIYTSGSTGTPKGVMLTQKTVSNFIASMFNKIDYLNDSIPHSIVSITTVSFDIFAFETLVSLCSGLKLFMTNESEQKITVELEKLLLKNNIEIIQSTPSIMSFHLENATLNGFSKLNYVMLAGEQLPKRLVDKIKNISSYCIIYNGYGPSETTIFSTVKNVTDLDKINIGEPIANTQIYILNNQLSLLPIGTVGEIYIAGDGVGKGYLDRNDLTKERYLPNPFKDNSIMYKTGDLGLWLNNGSIECMGRADHQVKLRGLRIELGEIEECINSFDKDKNIKSAVIVKEDNHKANLIAFVSSKKQLNITELRKYLHSKLPNYMIPNAFTLLDELPFTPNGKIDRKALIAYNIETEVAVESFVKPRNEIESHIVDSIKKKLCLEEFGIDNNIFDYCADSLTIINILTDLFQYDLSLKVYDFYKYPTVRELYDNLFSKDKSNKDLHVENLLKLNEDVKKFPTDTDCINIEPSNNIFLTGSTGFLGAHILIELLKNYPNVNIYCAIRRKGNINIEKRLMDKIHFYFGNKYDSDINNRVVCIEADINKTDIGLSNSDMENLAKNINTVIHCAANVKHYGNYDDFEKTNINGTKNIIKFCKRLNISLNYISTMTISGNYLIEQNNNFVFDENTFFENQSFDDNVYSKSKLLAESMVLEAMNDGLSTTIFRIGDLSGRYSDGVFQENIEDNSIYLRLKSILEICAVPESIFNNNLEFSPVDYAASAICKIIYSNKSLNRIFHIYNPNYLKVHEIIDYVLNLNYNIKILTDNEFLSVVKSLSNDINNQFKISGIINDFTNTNDLVYNHIIETDNSLTCKYLDNLNFTWPTLDFVYIEKLIDYMKKVGFLAS